MKYCLTIFFLLFIFNLPAQLPPEFQDQLMSTDFVFPVGIDFDENGRGFCWEKGGKVWIIDEDGNKEPEPLIDISEEVGDWHDHGMLGFATDPNFNDNGFYYLLYVVDRHHLMQFGSSTYHPDSSAYYDATIGRVTRYTADANNDFKTTITGSRQVLVGETKETGFPILMPSHGAGSICFGNDGTLIVSFGESGSFLSADGGNDPSTYFEQALADGIIQEKENVGAFKSQLIDNLNGKIIRIDPETGDGISSNPWYDTENPRAARSRVWALGLRNPFRVAMRPNTGSHDPEAANPGVIMASDVGGALWEEINVIDAPGMNFGWPVFEGHFHQDAFAGLQPLNLDAINPLADLGGCNQAYFNFHHLIKQDHLNADEIIFLHPCEQSDIIPEEIPTFVHDRPAISFITTREEGGPTKSYVSIFNEDGSPDVSDLNEEDCPVQGAHFRGSSSIAGFFYDGKTFPDIYQGKYFSADYAGGWIRVFDFDDNQNLIQVDSFHSDSKNIVSLSQHPDGSVWYVNVIDNELHRISYGGNAPPIAQIEADQFYGPSPLVVQFDGTSSYDPNGTIWNYEWDFGDESSSSEVQPSHTFIADSDAPQGFEVSLLVMDSLAATGEQNVIISLNNTPPNVSINSFQDNSFYAINGFTNLPLTAEVIDLEHSKDALLFEWQTIFHHNTHTHPSPIINQQETSSILEPSGCNGETFWYVIKLKVTDPAGLVGTDEKSIYPYCENFVDFISLIGAPLENLVRLNWEVQNTNMVSTYVIQRGNTQNAFVDIGSLDALTSNLQFDDLAPILGTQLYRIKAIREDGGVMHSNPISVKWPEDPEVSVSPNPASDHFTVFVKNAAPIIRLRLFDASAKTVLDLNWKKPEGLDYLSRYVPITNLPNGVYFYDIQNGESEYSGKILVAN